MPLLPALSFPAFSLFQFLSSSLSSPRLLHWGQTCFLQSWPMIKPSPLQTSQDGGKSYSMISSGSCGNSWISGFPQISCRLFLRKTGPCVIPTMFLSVDLVGSYLWPYPVNLPATSQSVLSIRSPRASPGNCSKIGSNEINFVCAFCIWEILNQRHNL